MKTTYLVIPEEIASTFRALRFKITKLTIFTGGELPIDVDWDAEIFDIKSISEKGIDVIPSIFINKQELGKGELNDMEVTKKWCPDNTYKVAFVKLPFQFQTDLLANDYTRTD